MPVDIKNECREIYQKLYQWHTNEIQKIDSKLSKAKDQEELKKIKVVENRLIVERRRIRKIYPEEFDEDEFDTKL